MNYANFLRRPHATKNPVRLLAIGHRQDLQTIIDRLCVLGFCDHAEWSKPQPYREQPGDHFTILTKWIDRDSKL